MSATEPHISFPARSRPALFRFALAVGLSLVLAGPGRGATFEWPRVTEAEKTMDVPVWSGEAGAGPWNSAIILFEEAMVDDTPLRSRDVIVHRRIRILTEAGRPRARVSVSVAEAEQELLELQGRTITADGRELSLAADAISRETGASGTTTVVFELPEAGPGAIVEYRYLLRGGTVPSLGGWVFQHDVPCVRSTFTWRPSLGRTSHWTLLGADEFDPEVVPLTSEASPDSLSGVRFEIRNIATAAPEPYGPPAVETRARLVTTYTEYALGDSEYWDAFALSAAERQDQFLSGTERLSAAVLAGSPAPGDFEGRIRRAYDFVQANVRLNPGATGQAMPSTADSVLQAGFTDPEGMSFIFIAALKALGIEATRAFVVDRDAAFFHPEVQSPAQFSRTLTAVTPGNGKVFFFSPGTPHAPPGVLPWYVQGITALLAGKSGAIFAPTPLDGPDMNQVTRTAHLVLGNDGRVSGDVRLEYAGQPELETRTLEAGNPGAARRSLESEWRRQVPKLAIDSMRVENLDSRDRNLSVAGSFRADGFGAFVDDRMLVNPASLGREAANPFPAAIRRHPVLFPYARVTTDNVTVSIPRGWRLDTLPESIQFGNAAGTYRTFWSFDGENLVYQRVTVLNTARYAPETYEALRELYRAIGEGDRTLAALLRVPILPSQR